MSIAEEKKALRARLRSEASPSGKAFRQPEWLSLPGIDEARVVLAYHALPDEVPTAELLAQLLAAGKTVLLPRCQPDGTLTLHTYRGPADVAEGAYHIMEPVTPATTLLPDLVIVPAMAYDRAGHRLGRGRGYYDRLLARLPNARTIGLCYDTRLLDNIPTEPHDRQVDAVVAVPIGK